MPEPSGVNEQRRRLRAFVLANHPDRGGDHQDFVAGLTALRQGRPVSAADLPRVYRRRRGLSGWLGIGRPQPPHRSLD